MLSASELLKEMVRFPSLSHQEGPIASFMEEYVQRPGVKVGRFEDNLFFSIGNGEPRLILNSHLDVVPPSEGHPYEPFDPVEVEGKIYGRGSSDAKASGAAMTTALLSLAQEGWKPLSGEVIVALTVCEEIGAEDNGLMALRPHLPKLHAGLVGEPTSLQPVTAQKGLLILKVNAHGKSAHAARAHLGENAIVKAARDIAMLGAYQFEHSDPLLGKPTLCITTINGGTARNVVPDLCTFYTDIRSVPGYTHEDITNSINALLDSDVLVHSDRIIPVSTPSSSTIVQSCLKVLPQTQPVGSPTASDWIFLADLPVVKIGPGNSELSHTADEHVAVDDVNRAAQIYAKIIKEYYAEQAASR